MITVLAALAALALVGCTGSVDASSPELVELAEPLVAAHDTLLGHAALAADDLDAAEEEWPETRARVREALERVPDPEGSGLAARERSTLIGYARGLQVAVAAWDDVHDGEASPDAVETAQARMRHLDRLRTGVTP